MHDTLIKHALRLALIYRTGGCLRLRPVCAKQRAFTAISYPVYKILRASHLRRQMWLGVRIPRS